jgi:hypothetical protein
MYPGIILSEAIYVREIVAPPAIYGSIHVLAKVVLGFAQYSKLLPNH